MFFQSHIRMRDLKVWLGRRPGLERSPRAAVLRVHGHARSGAEPSGADTPVSPSSFLQIVASFQKSLSLHPGLGAWLSVCEGGGRVGGWFTSNTSLTSLFPSPPPDSSGDGWPPRSHELLGACGAPLPAFPVGVPSTLLHQAPLCVSFPPFRKLENSPIL